MAMIISYVQISFYHSLIIVILRYSNIWTRSRSENITVVFSFSLRLFIGFRRLFLFLFLFLLHFFLLFIELQLNLGHHVEVTHDYPWITINHWFFHGTRKTCAIGVLVWYDWSTICKASFNTFLGGLILTSDSQIIILFNLLFDLAEDSYG